MIPEQLQKEDFRFILLRHKDKIPIEKDWPTTANYRYDDDRIKNHNGNIGIATGYGNLLVVDFDDIKIQNTIIKNLPETFTIKTGTGKLHKYFICDDGESIKVLDRDKNSIADLQFKGKQVVTAPSIHPNGTRYQVVDDSEIAETNFAEIKALFGRWLKDETVVPTTTTSEKDVVLEQIKQKMSMPTLLRKYNIDTSINPTKCPLHISKAGKCLSFDNELVHCFHCEELNGDIFSVVIKLDDCNFQEAKIKIASMVGVEIKEEKNKRKKDKDKPLEISFKIDGNLIIEEIYDEKNGVRFAIWNGTDVKYEKKIDIDGIEYVPIFGEEVEKKALLLPTKATVYGTDEELNNEIKEFINKWLDIPKDVLQFALWNIKRSWVYDRFHTLNYLRALGDTGMGKTRFLDVLGYIHYKPIATSGATTAAPIFRIIEKWKGTLIMDEADFSKSDEAQDIIKIINLGYEKGKHILRCEQNNISTINLFDPYCPKILATRRSFTDKATESRCITQVMRGTDRQDIPLNLNKDFFDTTQQLRNKLLMWRFKNYHKIEPDTEINLGLELEPRVKQIVNSFVSLFGDDKKQLEDFKVFIKKHQEDIIEERQNSWAGSIVSAIHDLIEEGKTNISAKDIIEKGNLTGKGGELIKPRGLNSTLKTLGFEKAEQKRIDGVIKRCLPLKKTMIRDLFKRYGCTDVPIVPVVTGSKEFKKELQKEQKELKSGQGGALPYIGTTGTSVQPILNTTQVKDTLISLFAMEPEIEIQQFLTRYPKDFHAAIDIMLDGLKSDGEIFEPKPGFIKLLQ